MDSKPQVPHNRNMPSSRMPVMDASRSRSMEPDISSLREQILANAYQSHFEVPTLEENRRPPVLALVTISYKNVFKQDFNEKRLPGFKAIVAYADRKREPFIIGATTNSRTSAIESLLVETEERLGRQMSLPEAERNVLPPTSEQQSKQVWTPETALYGKGRRVEASQRARNERLQGKYGCLDLQEPFYPR